MIYSFDIFDTLITRISYAPIGIFSYMQEYLLQHQTEWNMAYGVIRKFYDLRVSAERNARFYHGSGEVTLEEIYKTFSDMTGIASSETEKLMLLEKNMEYTYSIGIRENIDILKEKLQGNNQVVLISDMYLDAVTIRGLLVKQDKIFENIPIYVSSEHNKTKDSGELYKYLQGTNNWKYSEWTHYGDNKHADYNVPMILGIKANLIEKKESYSWNNSIIANAGGLETAEGQLILGINKYLENSMNRSMDYKIGFSVAGPNLFNYVKWIITISVRDTIKTLYFIARDGYILKKIADIYIKSYKLPIRTSYIYGSRKAWRTEKTDEKELVKKYYEQEINESEKYALVDLQGTGNSIQNLTQIVQKRVIVFYYYYFGNNQYGDCKNYIYTLKNEINNIEILCSADHGATLGYRLGADGACEPVLQKENWTDIQRESFKNYVRGVVEFTEFICLLQKQSKIEYDFEKIGRDLLQHVYNGSDRAIRDFIGELHYSYDNISDTVYAPIISENEIRVYIENPKLYKGDNIGYSIKRSGEKVQKIYSQAMLEKRNIEWNVRLKKHIKVIQYGAGKLGKKYNPYFQQLECIEVIGWVDAKYDAYQKLGMHIRSIQEAVNMEYDFLVLTVGKKLEKEVKDSLIETGIPKNKIILLGELRRLLELNL